MLVSSGMVTTPSPHCNQKIEFDATMPSKYECPYCDKQFNWVKGQNPIQSAILRIQKR